jgi:hypothetical protein
VNGLAPGWTRRALGDEERAELRAAAARASRFPRRLGLMTAMIAAVLANLLRGSRGPVALAVVAFGAVVLATAWGRWRRARRLGARLAADADGGWVDRSEGGALEVLPAASLPWTERGAPAGWRSAAAHPGGGRGAARGRGG